MEVPCGRGTLLHRDGLRWSRIRARNPNTGLGKITRMGSTLVVAAGDGIEGLLGVVSL
ncbi:MAG: hypothetical protein KJO07_15730 [Deltaproteobacteria bacterium]|nr:hypothetical protein [Deltaproteobacteria bacterium]